MVDTLSDMNCMQQLPEIEDAFMQQASRYKKRPITAHQRKEFMRWAKKYLNKYTRLPKSMKLSYISYFIYFNKLAKPTEININTDEEEFSKVEEHVGSRGPSQTFLPGFRPKNIRALYDEGNMLICDGCDSWQVWSAQEAITWYINTPSNITLCPRCKSEYEF